MSDHAAREECLDGIDAVRKDAVSPCVTMPPIREMHRLLDRVEYGGAVVSGHATLDTYTYDTEHDTNTLRNAASN